MTSEFTIQDYERTRQEIERRKLSFYRPYLKQQEFHKAGATFRERLLRAGNQCSGIWNFIQMVGEVRLSSEVFFEKDANVLSWDGESECTAQISGGFLKGIEPVFRLVTESGHFFDCSSSHQILTEHGYRRIDQIMSQLNGLYLLHKDEDYLANCVAYGYLDGQQLLSPEDIALRQPPSSVDAQKHNLIFSIKDVEEHIHQYTNIFAEYDHLSTFECVPHQLKNLFDLFSVSKVKSDVLELTNLHQKILQLVSMASCLVRSFDESVLLDAKVFSQNNEPGISSSAVNMLAQCVWLSQSSLRFPGAQTRDCSTQLLNHDSVHRLIFYPFKSPSLIGGCNIVAFVPIGFQPIIDCHVENVNNYKAAGIYHHNCGKTMAAAAEVAMHALGRYPSWWEGRVFKKAPVIWCGGITGEVTRDTVQRLLIGDEANPGGFIPKEDIIETTPSRGVADLKDTIFVKHSSGGTTRLRLKYYEQGREKWQGDTVDLVWFDEEPPLDLYMEGLTRTNATGGEVFLTFTPLKGMSETVRRFLVDVSPDRSDTNMTIMDALHIAPEERKKIIDSYPVHEREARINGTPMLGSGRIFPIAESEISIKAFNPLDMPWYWMELAGLDFGWDHPTAGAKILYDPQGDVIYLTNVYKRREATPLIHASALKPWGKELQWAWPHDGLQHDKGSGETLAKQYETQGLKMLPEKASFDDERGYGVEASIADLLMRMESGRFKVFSHLTEFFEEFRLYHRKDGKVVKEYDDVISAVRAACMMLRYAKPIRPPSSSPNGSGGFFKSNYNPLSVAYIKKSLGERK